MNTYQKRKLLLWSVVALFALVIIIAGGVGVVYWHGIRTDAAITQQGDIALSVADKDVPLGETVTVSATYRCPWHRFPAHVEAKAGSGSQLVGEPSIKKVSRGLGYTLWQVSVKVQPFRTGSIGKGSVDVSFNQVEGSKQEVERSWSIPALKVSQLKVDGNSLAVAGALDKPESTGSAKWWVLAGASLLFIAVAIGGALFLFGRRKEKETPIFSWSVALMELSRLRKGLAEHEISGEICLVKLTDIVRSYLEKRFALRAPTQTTEEFLRDLRRDDALLAEKHRSFLGDFMTAAEMVKFAKLPTDTEMLENALGHAERLVKETKPIENGRSGK